MPNATAVLLLFALLAAGCSSAPRREQVPPTDWSVVPGPAPRVTLPSEKTNVVIAPEPENTWLPLARWAAQRNLSEPQALTLSPTVQYTLSSSNGVLVVQVGSLQAYWNGLQVWLGFTPQMIDGEVFLHSLDLRKNIAPLFQSQIEFAPTNRTIVIDPGHGGGNTGTRSIVDGRFEKEFTLDWALRLAPLLEQRGWRVFLTRTNDVELSLADRVNFADEHAADFFLSLHFNAAPGGQHNAGVETYCLTPSGMASNLTREFEDDPALVFANNAFDADNLRYAVRLHRAVTTASGSMDRGVRHARFMGVLRGQRRPAVLMEGGYLSNPAEARRIADPQYRQKLAAAVAEAL